MSKIKKLDYSYEKNPLITVISDASYKDNHGGYAFWCMSDSGVIKEAGEFDFKLYSCHEAEVLALGRAIRTGLEKLGMKIGGAIVAQSDSLMALGLFLRFGYGVSAKNSDRDIIIPDSYEPNMLQKRVIKDTIDLLKDHQVKLVLKHIKGHTNKTDRRSFINRKVDFEARRHRINRQGRLGTVTV